MTIEEMKQRKRELGLSNAQIAERSGVPIGTVQKIFSGETTAPRYRTLQALQRVLEASGPSSFSYEDGLPPTGAGASLLQEAALAYGRRDMRKTVEDFFAMPEDWRGELIDGVLYDMSAPSILHQRMASLIGRQLEDYVDANDGQCLVCSLPVNTQLDRDLHTMVEPDISVICDRRKIRNRVIYGAPDMIVEILSPSTRRRDIFVKTAKYFRAGVREYWIVDPDGRTVDVYDPDAKVIPERYTFDEEVPVAIWGGACRVDFRRIYEKVAFLYDADGYSQE